MTTYVPSESAAAAIGAVGAKEAAADVKETAESILSNTLKAKSNFDQDSYFGVIARSIPGSVVNSQQGQVQMLANISQTLRNIEKNQTALAGSLAEFSRTLKVQNQIQSEALTIQQLAVADQIAFNSFQKAETVAALKRNDIEPAKLPSAREIMEQTIENFKALRLITVANNLVSGVTDAIFGQAVDYIKQSTIVTTGQAAIEDFFKYVGLNRLADLAANPTKVANRAAQVAAEIKARAGLSTPDANIPE